MGLPAAWEVTAAAARAGEVAEAAGIGDSVTVIVTGALVTHTVEVSCGPQVSVSVSVMTFAYAVEASKRPESH